MESNKKRYLAVTAVLCALLLIISLAALYLGSSKIAVGEIVDVILGKGDNTHEIILKNIRLPRLVAGILAGVALSASGILLQSVTGNPLCSPGVLGINAGAGFALILFMYAFPELYRLYPAAAFAGAAASTGIIVLLHLFRHSSKLRLVLSGIAVSSVFSAGISFISMLDADLLQSYNSFAIGGLSFVRMKELAVPAVIIAICFVMSMIIAPTLNILCVGGETARGLGVNVNAVYVVSLLLASALAASAVSFSGLLGFVGLIVPNMARKLVGSDLRRLFPCCAMLGACIVVVSDVIGRTLFAPTEMPVGIIMSFVGGPFFLWLLFKKDKSKGGVNYD